MHIPAAAHHIRPHRHAHLQAAAARVACAPHTVVHISDTARRRCERAAGVHRGPRESARAAVKAVKAVGEEEAKTGADVVIVILGDDGDRLLGRYVDRLYRICTLRRRGRCGVLPMHILVPSADT